VIESHPINSNNQFLSEAIVICFRCHSNTMCGILAVLGCIDNSQAKRSRIIELSRRYSSVSIESIMKPAQCY
jgi:hypothetical protein